MITSLRAVYEGDGVFRVLETPPPLYVNQQVAEFFRRGAENEIRIHSSAQAVSDVIHRVMLSEAVKTY